MGRMASRPLVPPQPVVAGRAGAPLAAVLLVWGRRCSFRPLGRQGPVGRVGAAWRPYVALHFIASPLSVVLMAWGAQAWGEVRLALVGQGSSWPAWRWAVGGAAVDGRRLGVSGAMLVYFWLLLLEALALAR